MRIVLDSRGLYFPEQNDLPTLARQLDHDLRSPLTTICSYAQCLAMAPDLPPEKQQYYCRIVEAEARRIGRLTGYHLTIIAPPLFNHLEEISFAQAFVEAWEDLRDIFELYEITVQYPPAPEITFLWAPLVLQQLIWATLDLGLQAAMAQRFLALRWEPAEAALGMNLQCAGRPEKPLMESFAFRALQVLLQQRGGEAILRHDKEWLTLRLPLRGEVCSYQSASSLEKSA